MKKEVFTQEFEKCFTVFQQVQLMKKYIDELLENEHTPVDISGKVDKTTTFTDPNGNPYEGETGWVVDDDKLFYETKIRSTQPSVYDYSAYFYMGEDSIYLDNHNINLAMDDNVFYVNCEVDEGYYISGRVETNGQSSVGITAGNNTLKITSDNGLLYNDKPIGEIYLHRVQLAINAENIGFTGGELDIYSTKDNITIDDFYEYLQSYLKVSARINSLRLITSINNDAVEIKYVGYNDTYSIQKYVLTYNPDAELKVYYETTYTPGVDFESFKSYINKFTLLTTTKL